MTEPNWQARNRAIARDLMGDIRDEHPGGFWRESDGVTVASTNFHKGAAAFDRLVKELERRECEIYLHDHLKHRGNGRECYWDVYSLGICPPIKTSPDYKEALVLAVTEEGEFCPKCGEEPALDNVDPDGLLTCKCGFRGELEDYVPARVRPEIAKGKAEAGK